MKNNKSASLFPRELVIESLKQAFVKLNPRTMIKNPIMFTVEVATWVMLLVIVGIAVTGDTTQGSVGYNIAIFIVLFVTLLRILPKLLLKPVEKHKPTVCGKPGKKRRLNCLSMVRQK